MLLEIQHRGEFPGGPVVRTWCFQLSLQWAWGSTPGQGTKILQAAWCGQKKKKKNRKKEIKQRGRHHHSHRGFNKIYPASLNNSNQAVSLMNSEVSMMKKQSYKTAWPLIF